MGSLIVEGPLVELRPIHDEVTRTYGDRVFVSEIHEPVDDVFNPGQLGESAIVSFLVEYGAGLASGGTVSLIAAIRNTIQKAKTNRVQIREQQPEDEPGESGGLEDSD